MARGGRRYVRDARGRFASKGVGGMFGYTGQTSGMGARLKTPGKTRAGGGSRQKLQPKRSGTVGKPKGLKPQPARQLRTGVAVNRMSAINARIANKPDIAQQHIPGRFRGQAGKRMEASIDRAVKQVNALQMSALMKPKAQARAERTAAAQAKREAAAAKPKRVRTPESLRVSRAKQVQKRRGINISNPAGWRPESAGRMAANAARTQQKALEFYKSKPRRR